VTRRVLKWTGVGCTLALAALAVTSVWLDVMFDAPYWGASARRAAFRLDWRTGELVDAFGPRGWSVAAHTPRVTVLPAVVQIPIGSSMTIYNVIVPLWVPILLIGAPTAWLWRRDRPRPAYACRTCGYDLRGVENGDPCPECGGAVTLA
jgi:hypothetical protein